MNMELNFRSATNIAERVAKGFSMVRPGDVITYSEMCHVEGTRLRRGMYYRLRGKTSVLLMNLGSDAPYEDRIEAGGRTIIYEGHDIPNRKGGPDPKTVNQPEFTARGQMTQNGFFHRAAQSYRARKRPAESVRVYEKTKRGMWKYHGLFRLVDSWREVSNGRRVFRFRFERTRRKE